MTTETRLLRVLTRRDVLALATMIVSRRSSESATSVRVPSSSWMPDLTA